MGHRRRNPKRSNFLSTSQQSPGNINVNLGEGIDAGLVFKIALVSLVVGALLGAWATHKWRTFQISEAYESRIGVLETRHALRADSLEIVKASIAVAHARFEEISKESVRLAVDLESATLEADDARSYVDSLHAASDTTTSSLLEEIGGLRQALVTREIQCAICDQRVDTLEASIKELLAIDTVKDRQIFFLNAINSDLQEKFDLAQLELDRAAGSIGWKPLGLVSAGTAFLLVLTLVVK